MSAPTPAPTPAPQTPPQVVPFVTQNAASSQVVPFVTQNAASSQVQVAPLQYPSAPASHANWNTPASAEPVEAPLAQDDFLVASPLRAPRSPIAALLANKKVLLIAGGAVVVIVVLIVALTGGSKAADAPKTAVSSVTPPPASPVPAPPTEPVSADPTPVETAPTAEPPSSGSATPPQPPTTAPVTGTKAVAVAPIKKPAAKTVAGKQVVLEYDSGQRDVQKAATPTREDEPLVLKARAEYSAGNRRLFAGDPTGAIRSYRQALAVYPGYVAGYRGLGLAYAQLGDKTAALRALRSYVSLVPTAKDVPLIKKRIAALQVP